MKAPLVVLMLLVGCNTSPTGPDGTDGVVHSELGFIIIGMSEYLDAGGPVTQLHADLADRWWRELMVDLQSAGMSRAGGESTPRSARVYLHQPRDADSLFRDDQGNVVGGWYDARGSGALHVPGDYTDPDGMLGARPALQPIKHEALHHWCYRTMGHACVADSDLDHNGKKDDHVWLLPDGTNIWVLTWQ